MTRAERQAVIERLVRRKPVATQAALMRLLDRQGMCVDQSTLSRDLNELGIRKQGGRYVLPEPPEASASELNYASVVRWFAVCGPNLIVVKTEIGQAQPVAVWIDGQSESSIVATLAGDDVIFVASKTSRSQTVALRRLTQWFGDKHE